jgi:hypothetical protein
MKYSYVMGFCPCVVVPLSLMAFLSTRRSSGYNGTGTRGRHGERRGSIHRYILSKHWLKLFVFFFQQYRIMMMTVYTDSMYYALLHESVNKMVISNFMRTAYSPPSSLCFGTA